MFILVSLAIIIVFVIGLVVIAGYSKDKRLLTSQWKTEDYWYLKGLFEHDEDELYPWETSHPKDMQAGYLFTKTTADLVKVLEKCKEDRLKQLSIKIYNEFTKVLGCYTRLCSHFKLMTPDVKVRNRQNALKARYEKLQQCLQEVVVYALLAESNDLVGERSDDIVNETKSRIDSIEEIENFLNSI